MYSDGKLGKSKDCENKTIYTSVSLQRLNKHSYNYVADIITLQIR